MKRTIAGVALVLALAGCASAGGDLAPKASAFCSDLESGSTPLQLLSGQISAGEYTPREAADAAYVFAAKGCPEQLTSNAALREYLQGWGIDPDA